MADLLIYETGNGGDLKLRGNDLAMVDGVENMPYLACFGGNVEGNWWGNELLMPNRPDRHFVSETERTLNSVALNSAGRVKIEQAVLNDLAFLKKAMPGTSISVSASIAGVDKVVIKVNISGEQTVFVWNPETQELQ